MMSKEHHVIYLPGIGDQRSWGQSLIVKNWQIFGVKTHYHKIGWADGEPFEPKLQRITNKIDSLADKGFSVSLVGISAGASAALNAYMVRKNKISRIAYISGKLFGPENVNPRYYKLNPAFKDSLHLSDAYINKLTKQDQQKMLYVHGWGDRTVPANQNKLPGVSTKSVPAFGHILSIFLAITLYSRTVFNFLKS